MMRSKDSFIAPLQSLLFTRFSPGVRTRFADRTGSVDDRGLGLVDMAIICNWKRKGSKILWVLKFNRKLGEVRPDNEEQMPRYD
jgi:hypothetical protein